MCVCAPSSPKKTTKGYPRLVLFFAGLPFLGDMELELELWVDPITIKCMSMEP